VRTHLRKAQANPGTEKVVKLAQRKPVTQKSSSRTRFRRLVVKILKPGKLGNPRRPEVNGQSTAKESRRRKANGINANFAEPIGFETHVSGRRTQKKPKKLKRINPSTAQDKQHIEALPSTPNQQSDVTTQCKRTSRKRRGENSQPDKHGTKCGCNYTKRPIGDDGLYSPKACLSVTPTGACRHRSSSPQSRAGSHRPTTTCTRHCQTNRQGAGC